MSDTHCPHGQLLGTLCQECFAIDVHATLAEQVGVSPERAVASMQWMLVFCALLEGWGNAILQHDRSQQPADLAAAHAALEMLLQHASLRA